jgi:hypothetical protein
MTHGPTSQLPTCPSRHNGVGLAVAFLMDREANLWLLDVQSLAHQPQCSIDRFGSLDLEIRFDSYVVPVTFGIRVDGAYFNRTNIKIISDAVKIRCMTASGGSFPDERGTLEHLQIVGKLLGSGYRSRRRQDIHGLVGKFVAGDR